MGRDELPLARDGSPVREFAFWLRDLRRQAGLTYDQLAKASSYAVSTLQDACSGKRLPSLKLTVAFVEACDGDAGDWQRYWAQIKRALDPVAPQAERSVLPPWRPEFDDTEPELAGPVGELDSAVEPGGQAGGRRRPWVALVAAVSLLVTLAAVAIVLRGAHHSSSIRAVAATTEQQSAGQHSELEFHKGGAPSMADPHDVAGVGPRIDFGKTAMVSCKLLAPSIGSVSPDGYWYRIATAPWNDHYYVAANTFLNGDPVRGPYSHNTDFAVPDC